MNKFIVIVLVASILASANGFGFRRRSPRLANRYFLRPYERYHPLQRFPLFAPSYYYRPVYYVDPFEEVLDELLSVQEMKEVPKENVTHYHYSEVCNSFEDGSSICEIDNNGTKTQEVSLPEAISSGVIDSYALDVISLSYLSNDTFEETINSTVENVKKDFNITSSWVVNEIRNQILHNIKDKIGYDFYGTQQPKIDPQQSHSESKDDPRNQLPPEYDDDYEFSEDLVQEEQIAEEIILL